MIRLLMIAVLLLSFQVELLAQEAVLKNGRNVVYSDQKRVLEAEESEFFQTMVLKTSNTFSKCTPEGYMLTGKWLPDYEEVYRSELLDKENKPLSFEIVLKWSPIEKSIGKKDVFLKVLVNVESRSFNATSPFKAVKDSLFLSWSQGSLKWKSGNTASNYKGNGRVVALGNWETSLKSANSLLIKAKWPKPSFNIVNNIALLIGGEESIVVEILGKIPQDRLKALLQYREIWP